MCVFGLCANETAISANNGLEPELIDIGRRRTTRRRWTMSTFRHCRSGRSVCCLSNCLSVFVLTDFIGHSHAITLREKQYRMIIYLVLVLKLRVKNIS